MVSGKHKSNSMRMVYVKTPGNRVVVHYRARNPSISRCALCKEPLKGVPRLLPAKARNTAISKRRPSRPYGGYACTKCMRKMIKDSILNAE